MYIFCNEQFIPHDTPCITADDRGFCLGDGIFETLLSYNRNIPFYTQHWQRLSNSANVLNINLSSNYNKDYIYSILQDLLAKNYPDNFKDTYLGFKIIVTRGAGPRSIEPINNYNYKPNLVISTFEVRPELNLPKNLCVATYRINQQSILPQIKSLNYLDKIIAKQQALKHNYDDCLFLNLDNNITEASTSNIFFILANNQVITPKISDGVLPGIMRGYVIKTLKEHEIKVIEESISLTNLKNSLKPKSAFLTNSIQGITLVDKIDDLVMGCQEEYNQIPNLIKGCLDRTIHPSYSI